MFKCDICQEFTHRDRRLGEIRKTITLPFVPTPGIVISIGDCFGSKIFEVLYSVDDNDFTVVIEESVYPSSFSDEEAKGLFKRDLSNLIIAGFSLDI